MSIFHQKDLEIFFKVKASPYFWREKAWESKYAAEILWPVGIANMKAISQGVGEGNILELLAQNPNILSIPLSLMGFSIECLLKAIIVRDNPAFVSNGVLSRKLRSHDLIKLAKTAKYNLTQNEKIFCKQAYKAMTVDSRYPISLAAGDEEMSVEIGGNAREVFLELYDKIYPNVGQIGATSI